MSSSEASEIVEEVPSSMSLQMVWIWQEFAPEAHEAEAWKKLEEAKLAGALEEQKLVAEFVLEKDPKASKKDSEAIKSTKIKPGALSLTSGS